MWKKILPVILIAAVIFISGCTSTQQTSQEVTCNRPYIKVGTTCCLDQNGNNVCDTDEKPVQTCGDGVCQSSESCSTCVTDCGECFSFGIEKINYDCLIDKLPTSSSGGISIITQYLTVDKASDKNGAINNIIFSTPKDSNVPQGKWKIDTKMLSPDGGVYFTNHAEFSNYQETIPCEDTSKRCFSPFAYDIIPMPYVQNGKLEATLTSPTNIQKTKQVTLTDTDCKVLSLSTDQLFSLVKATFINNGFSLSDINPSGFQKRDAGLYYGGGYYSSYQLSLKSGQNVEWSVPIYYYDNVYRTSYEELLNKINSLGNYVSATLISTPNGKYIKEVQSSGTVNYDIICGHKSIITLYVVSGIDETKIVKIIGELLQICSG